MHPRLIIYVQYIIVIISEIQWLALHKLIEHLSFFFNWLENFHFTVVFFTSVDTAIKFVFNSTSLPAVPGLLGRLATVMPIFAAAVVAPEAIVELTYLLRKKKLKNMYIYILTKIALKSYINLVWGFSNSFNR